MTSMTSFKKFCSVCLGFVDPDENKPEVELQLDKKIIENTLRQHFDDPSIKVKKGRFNLIIYRCF